MRRSSGRLSAIFLLFVSLCCFSILRAGKNTREIAYEIESLNYRLMDVSSRFKSIRERFEAINLVVENSSSKSSSQPQEVLPLEEYPIEEHQAVPRVVEVDNSNDLEDKSKEHADIEPKSERIGFYLLPFLGVSLPNDQKWQSFGGDWEIDSGTGVIGGVRFGYNSRNFLADLQLSSFRNDLKKINLPIGISGDVDGLGIHFSGGGRLPFNESESVSAIAGLGVGGIYQNISFNLSGVPVEEWDFLLSTQLFAGLEFLPSEDILLGLRYRWFHIHEMKSFDSRNLHLIELSAGYLF
jgi:hypothetical protein